MWAAGTLADLAVLLHGENRESTTAQHAAGGAHGEGQLADVPLGNCQSWLFRADLQADLLLLHELAHVALPSIGPLLNRSVLTSPNHRDVRAPPTRHDSPPTPAQTGRRATSRATPYWSP